MNLHLLETVGNISPWWVGIAFLAVLLGSLMFIRNNGKGRPHS